MFIHFIDCTVSLFLYRKISDKNKHLGYSNKWLSYFRKRGIKMDKKYEGYPVAELSEEQLQKIQQLEQEIASSLNEHIVLIAYEEKI
jgi:transposase